MAGAWIQRSRFRLVECPVPGCSTGRGRQPLWGTVPGIKRHVRLVHGEFALAHVRWCSVYPWDSPWREELRFSGEAGKERLAALTFAELRIRARERGVTQSGKSKAQLVETIHRTYRLSLEEARRAFGNGAEESRTMHPVYEPALLYNPLRDLQTSGVDHGRAGRVSGPAQPRRGRRATFLLHNSMACPLGCPSKGGFGVMVATIVGMKRHFAWVHPGLGDSVEWPPLYLHSVSGYVWAAKPKPLEEMTVRQLRFEARKRGVSQTGKNRADFIDALR